MNNRSRSNSYPLLKNSIGPQAVQHIAECLKDIHPDFDSVGFIQTANSELGQLELKARVHHLIKVLHEYLPGDFEQTAQILCQVKRHQNAQQTPVIKAFTAWPLIDYVAVYGLQDPEIALATLAQLTGLFSAEFAIRPFIQQHYELTYEHLQHWCNSSDYHIRRLVSEGTRPRLPWGSQLPKFITNPDPIFPLLEKLNNDSEDYVRRSVANNLNDISKDHPERVLNTCHKWLKKPSTEKSWIVRHATRTLVKKGDPRVFTLLGYSTSPKINVELKIDKQKLTVGENQAFTVSITSTSAQNQKLLIDYAVHFNKANGQQSAKVFKLKILELAAGVSLELTKIHSFAPLSTRRYYAGKHKIEIIVNGRNVASAAFELLG